VNVAVAVGVGVKVAVGVGVGVAVGMSQSTKLEPSFTLGIRPAWKVFCWGTTPLKVTREVSDPRPPDSLKMRRSLANPLKSDLGYAQMN
jgi:hypothetical protein